MNHEASDYRRFFFYDRNLPQRKKRTNAENFRDNLDFPISFCYFVPSNQGVMAQQHKKRKRRSYQYHAITFKLSSGQYRSLRNYCKARKTTPIKLIKRNIERFITAYEYEVPTELYLTENQLDLFDETVTSD